MHVVILVQFNGSSLSIGERFKESNATVDLSILQYESD